MFMKLCPQCEASYTGSLDELHYLVGDALRAVITANADPEWFNENPDPLWPGSAVTGPATYTREDLMRFLQGAVQSAAFKMKQRSEKP
jgi:hypothetical protein